MLRFPIALAMTIWTGVCTVSAEEIEAAIADAVEKQNWKQARELLQKGADVDAAQVDGMTALHWAVFHNRTELVQQLVAAGADVKAKNRYGVPVLYGGCLNGNGQIVELLLKKGADPNEALRGGETPLMTAARTGKPGPVKALLAHGADIDAGERKGQTAIMWAAAEGNVEAVDLLIEEGADYRTPLKSGFTPLFFAVREGRTDVVLRLLDAGLDVNDPMQIERKTGKGPQSGTTPLILAVENGHFELAAKLLERGADPNEKRTGFTPLHAITRVRKPIRGDGDPPPIGSGKMSSLQFVKVLVKHGADVNARHGKTGAGAGRLNKTDATPFLLAAETGDVPLLKLLQGLGADPDMKNKDKITPLLAAAGVGVLGNGEESAGTEEDAIATVKYLLDLGADVNAIDDRNNSAMHGAAYKSWSKLAVFLHENGADLEAWNRKNNFGWTPLMIAQGHRPGNFRPSQETVEVIAELMRAEGAVPASTSHSSSAAETR
jgi:ankyrin repeat protein